MSFSERVLQDLSEMDVIQDADEFGLHEMSGNLFELSSGPHRILLSRDAGIDLAFRLADFLAALEAKEARDQKNAG